MTRLRDRWPSAVALGLFVFVLDWAGYNKWEPDLLFPKPLSQVYWHLPIELLFAGIFAAVWPKEWR